MNQRFRQGSDSLGGFWSLFVTQFQGAFSDNVVKNLAIFMLVAMDLTLAEKHRIGELVGALFALPFILFSMAGGSNLVITGAGCRQEHAQTSSAAASRGRKGKACDC